MKTSNYLIVYCLLVLTASNCRNEGVFSQKSELNWCLPEGHNILEEVVNDTAAVQLDKSGVLKNLLDSVEQYLDDLVYLPRPVKNRVFRELVNSGRYDCFDEIRLESLAGLYLADYNRTKAFQMDIARFKQMMRQRKSIATLQMNIHGYAIIGLPVTSKGAGTCKREVDAIDYPGNVQEETMEYVYLKVERLKLGDDLRVRIAVVENNVCLFNRPLEIGDTLDLINEGKLFVNIDPRFDTAN